MNNENLIVNMTKKDLFNAKNASVKVSDMLDVEICVSGCAIIKDGAKSKDGTNCDVGYIAVKDSVVIGFTSSVLIDEITDFSDYLEDCINDNEYPMIKITERKSNNGNTFYSFNII